MVVVHLAHSDDLLSLDLPPAGVATVQLVPEADLRLSPLPANEDPAPLEEGRKIDEPLIEPPRRKAHATPEDFARHHLVQVANQRLGRGGVAFVGAAIGVGFRGEPLPPHHLEDFDLPADVEELPLFTVELIENRVKDRQRGICLLDGKRPATGLVFCHGAAVRIRVLGAREYT